LENADLHEGSLPLLYILLVICITVLHPSQLAVKTRHSQRSLPLTGGCDRSRACFETPPAPIRTRFVWKCTN
jgi:hypothetical protein